MNACDNITRLSQELGVARNLLYYWRDKWLHAQPQPGLFREVCLRKQILRLEQVLANETMEVDFFKCACKEEGLDVDRGVSLAARHLRRNKNQDAVARWFEHRANV